MKKIGSGMKMKNKIDLQDRIKQLEAQVDMQLQSLHKLQLENTKLKNCVEAIKHNQELAVKWANGEVEN